MANPWFRFYHEFLTDPKVQRLSEVDQRRFIMLLCMRCCNGDVTLHDCDIAFQLRISDENWDATKANLLNKKLIDKENKPTNWEKRQKACDSSVERVRRHRDKQCNVTVTLPVTGVTLAEEDKEEDKDKRKKRVVKFKNETLRVFEYWKEVLNHPKAVLDKKRNVLISNLLRDGYSVDTLCLAIDGCKKSEWHQGKNEHGTVYDGIDLIFRDGSKVDRFVKIAEEKPGGNNNQRYTIDDETYKREKNRLALLKGEKNA